MSAGPSVKMEKSWQERAFVALTEFGGSDVNLHANLSDIGWDGGARKMESRPLMNGGRERVLSPMEDVTFTGTVYQTGVDATSFNGIASLFYGGLVDGTPSLSSVSTDSSSLNGVQQAEPTLTRKDVRVAVLFTNDTAATSATGAVSAGASNAAYRWVGEAGILTVYNKKFDDQVFVADVEIVFPPFDESGNARILEQEYTGDASDNLPALDSYS